MTVRRRVLLRILIVAVALSALAIAGSLSSYTGMARGVEFSPDRFSHRSFRYRVWCGFQVTPKETDEWQSRMDKYLHEEGYIGDTDIANPRWLLVKGFLPGVRGWHSSAKYMCQALGCWGDNDEWIVWSGEHPEMAQVLWPQVVNWARSENFDAVAALFRLMDQRKPSSPDELREWFELAERRD